MRNVLIFDIETNGLLRPNEKDLADTVHCIVTRSPSGQVNRYHDRTDMEREGSIVDGIEALERADVLVGHNVQGYDIPVLKKLYPSFLTERQPMVQDSMVLARLYFPDIIRSDWDRVKKGTLPRQLLGRHSLAAWGYRLGDKKGDFNNEKTDWTKFTQEMLDYCVQDTHVTASLVRFLEEKSISPTSVALEHEFSHAIDTMMMVGCGFDMAGAHALEDVLREKFESVAARLRVTMGPRVISWTTPKKGLKRTKLVSPNPGSRHQLATWLQDEYGWKPTDFTEGGIPKLDEGNIKRMDPDQVPVRDDLLEYFLLSKRLGQVVDGAQAWCKAAVEQDGLWRIYGYVNHNGTYTGRCAHSRPNVAQVPRVGSPYGAECRALFRPTSPGLSMVGCDMSGIEARILAHYTQPFDDGELIRNVLEGDVHQANADAAGLSRNDAKTALYALMYGAGDQRLSDATGKDGKKVRRALMQALPGLNRLTKAVERRFAERRVLTGLDGRTLRPKRAYSALNTLIQGGGAVAMKMATVIANRRKASYGARMLLHVHDEYQWECPAADAEGLGEMLVDSIREAGKQLKLRIPLDGESKVGSNWAETH